MAKYIHRDTLADWAYRRYGCSMASNIARFPAVDAELVRHGKWDGYVCSECNVCADYFISGDFYFDEKPNFCPNCGAKMYEEE